MKVLIVIGDIDLSCIPVQNLASLVACVRFSVSIENVRGCDLLKLLESVRSSRLNIYRQSLDTEETKTLVKALETYLELFAWSGYGEQEVTLDITAMTQCSGLGKCKDMIYMKGVTYKEQFRTWAEGRDWEMFDSDVDEFHLIRNEIFRTGFRN